MKIILLSFFLLSSIATASRPIRGTYEVPVLNSDLAPFSQFPIKFKSENYDRDFKKITFPLPIELTGTQNFITIYQKDERSWAGENASGECHKEGRTFICNLRFTKLQTDIEALEAVIIRNFPQQTEERLQVAKIFLEGENEIAGFTDHEPAGILRYRLRGGDRD